MKKEKRRPIERCPSGCSGSRLGLELVSPEDSWHACSGCAISWSFRGENMTNEDARAAGLCQGCTKKSAEPDHTCPFAEEINEDSESLCNCCSDCAYECAMHI